MKVLQSHALGLWGSKPDHTGNDIGVRWAGYRLPPVWILAWWVKPRLNPLNDIYTKI